MTDRTAHHWIASELGPDTQLASGRGAPGDEVLAYRAGARMRPGSPSRAREALAYLQDGHPGGKLALLA